jgi:ribonuclease HI
LINFSYNINDTIRIHKWKKNGWKTITNNDVINRDILERIDEMRSQIDVSFEHIPGHSGIYGNEQADKLATNGISKRVLQQPLITEKSKNFIHNPF